VAEGPQEPVEAEVVTTPITIRASYGGDAAVRAAYGSDTSASSLDEGLLASEEPGRDGHIDGALNISFDGE
jgi:hypothetical protein